MECMRLAFEKKDCNAVLSRDYIRTILHSLRFLVCDRIVPESREDRSACQNLNIKFLTFLKTFSPQTIGKILRTGEGSKK